MNEETRFDLHDGLHHSAQVDRDFEKSLKTLEHKGTIVLHDCNPECELLHQVPWPAGQTNWTGDVRKSIARLRMTRADLSVYVVDADRGCGIIRRGSQSLFHCRELLNYAFLSANRTALLKLKDVDSWLMEVGQ